jgi:hypothetical protein
MVFIALLGVIVQLLAILAILAILRNARHQSPEQDCALNTSQAPQN